MTVRVTSGSGSILQFRRGTQQARRHPERPGKQPDLEFFVVVITTPTGQTGRESPAPPLAPREGAPGIGVLARAPARPPLGVREHVGGVPGSPAAPAVLKKACEG